MSVQGVDLPGTRARARGPSTRGRSARRSAARRSTSRGSPTFGSAALCLAGALVVLSTASACQLLEPRPAGTPPRSETPPRADAPIPAKSRDAETSRTLVLTGATVMTAAGPTRERTDVMVRGDRIVALGTGLSVPAGAEVVDLTGRWLTPGLIDPHSHLGVYPSPRVSPHSDGNEATGPFKSSVRAAESFWPQDPGLRTAIAGGVTTLLVLPGSANLVGGQGATLRVLQGRAASDLRFPDAPATMKMACGENPKRVYGDRRNSEPATRMAEVALLRQQLETARTYEPEEDGSVDFEKRALREVVEGRTLIQNHCYRADEMLLRLELFAEFETRPRAFHHATEAYKIRDALAEAEVGAVVWADWWGQKMEMLDGVPANAAMLDAAGVRVALHSDSADDIQRLNQQAARALAAGRRAGISVDRDRAIRWITANPAWVLGIEREVGTIEPGKRADLTVWSGDPFSVYTRADLVFIDGELRYDRSRPELVPATDFELGLRPFLPEGAPRPEDTGGGSTGREAEADGAGEPAR